LFRLDLCLLFLVSSSELYCCFGFDSSFFLTGCGGGGGCSFSLSSSKSSSKSSSYAAVASSSTIGSGFGSSRLR